ncbi:MAG: thioredoxin-disulfide reductase [Deltaproteobacteria bacterium]|nr:thioredoxin-disulfide reductase [Deltaproteobacteria bacterium]MBW2138175.1 thioredoxin-disulfide reductase [Deltaproteobacteria bacterium]
MLDLIIIGGGPAGLTAGLYGARARMDLLLLEKLAPGGQVMNTNWVENYPGFPEGVSGFELVDRMKNQAEKFGLEIRSEEVIGLELAPEAKGVITPKERFATKAVILATGATWRKLGIEGEDLLIGKGVSYCATCDGPFYRDMDVAVIGGGDTAVEESLFLTRFAKKIYLVHRRDQLRATKLLQERAMAEEKISFVWDTIPLKILGDNGVEGLETKNLKTGEVTCIPVQGVFVFIGTTPNTELVKDKLELDPNGFVITDENMETSFPGVFAAGDVRSKMFRQIATAVGEGAAAARAAEKFIEEQHKAEK